MEIQADLGCLIVCQIWPNASWFSLHCLEVCFTRVSHVADDDQEGVMDNLLEALKTGSAFAVNRERKGERRRTPRAAGGT